jgi:hypothetical protein
MGRAGTKTKAGIGMFLLVIAVVIVVDRGAAQDHYDSSGSNVKVPSRESAGPAFFPPAVCLSFLPLSRCLGPFHWVVLPP